MHFLKRRLLIAICICFALGFGTGCSTLGSKSKSLPLRDLIKEDTKKLTPEEIEKLVGGQLKTQSFKTSVLLTEKTNRTDARIRYRMVRWIHHYVLESPRSMRRALLRGVKHKPIVEKTLDQHGLPKELYYLAMVESNFDSHSTSPVGATGYWQLMPATAKSHGLKVDEHQDERKDVTLSTAAAAKYLKRLYSRFNSWYLALAAYNSGPEKIARAVRKGNTQNFWELMEMKLLPQETLDYIPKFLAVWLIGENPHLFKLNVSD